MLLNLVFEFCDKFSSNILILQTPDVSALLEAAVCQQEAQHQAAAQGTLVTTEAPAVANEEEISNIVQTS